MFGRIFLALVIIGVTAAIVVANFGRSPDFARFKWRIEREVPLELKAQKVARQNIIHAIDAPGEVEADDEVGISAQVMGRIVAMPVEEGDQVRRGDLLVKLDDVNFKSQVEAAERRIEQLRFSIEMTKADIAKSKRDLADNEVLFSQKAIGENVLRDIRTIHAKDEARLKMTEAQLKESEAALVKAKEDLSYTTIRSPLDGVVSHRPAEIGEVVVIGTMNNQGTVIMTISSPKKLVVRANIDESDVPLVKPGQRTLIHLQHRAELIVQGVVERVSPKGAKGGTNKKNSAIKSAAAADNQVATFEAFIKIENPPPAVRMGMTANVEIQVQERVNVLSIPTQAVLHRRRRDLPTALVEELEAAERNRPSAIREDSTKRYYQIVFAVRNDKAECRLVKTGVSDENKVEVLGGLTEDETVITGPYRIFDKLQTGKTVKIVSDEELARQPGKS